MTNSQLSRSAAANELLARRTARRGLLAFTQYTYPRYLIDPVHTLIASTLDRVVTGELRRLMIFAPPQHGKSELASVRLPAYWLGRRPDDPVILTSYAAGLAHNKSRQVRDIVESEDYRALFGDLSPYTPVSTRADSRAVDHWSLTAHRGGLLAAGVGGPVTGHGGMLGIIDDPFENWEQAQSLTYRNRAWDWYRTTFRTRIWEDGAIILIMTRWQEDDLAGRLLNDQGNAWEVLRLPAIAETQDERDRNNAYMGLPVGGADPLDRAPGEPLSPSRFSSNALIEIRGDVGSMAWAAEYQGVPRPLEGSRIKRDWFTFIDNVPRNAKFVRYWDKAGTQGGTGAYTAGVLVARSADRTVIVDVRRGRWSAGERETVIKQTAASDRATWGAVDIWIEQEPGSGGKESAENTIRNLSGYRIKADRPSGDKDTRLEPFAIEAEKGAVFLLSATWNGDWLDEMAAIPNGAFRDQADATAGAFNKLAAKQPSVRRAAVSGLYGNP